MKKREKSKLFLLGVLFSAQFVLAACGTKQAEESSRQELIDGKEPVTLRLYAQYSDADTKEPMDYVLSELKKEMPWVTIELDVEAQDNGQKLKTYAATGDMPDIFNCNNDQINTLKKSKNIALLNDYVESTGYGAALKENNKDLLYDAEGNAYAFPYAGNEFILMYYNKELFKEHNLEVPQTFDELIQVVEAFNAKDITPISLFAQEGWVTAGMYDLIATKYVPEGIKGLDAGTTSIEEEGYKKAAQKLKELVDAGAFGKGAIGTNYDQAASLFYEEKAAMFVSGQWFVTDADKNLPGKVDWFYFPVTNDGGDNQFAMSGGSALGGYAISSSTPDIELAANVAAFISMKAAEYKYVERANTIVAINVEKEFNTEVTPMIQKLSEEIPRFTSTTAFSWGLANPEFKATLEEQTQIMITGGQSAENFIANLKSSLE